jgi:hypothetical protein
MHLDTGAREGFREWAAVPCQPQLFEKVGEPTPPPPQKTPTSANCTLSNCRRVREPGTPGPGFTKIWPPCICARLVASPWQGLGSSGSGTHERQGAAPIRWARMIWIVVVLLFIHCVCVHANTCVPNPWQRDVCPFQARRQGRLAWKVAPCLERKGSPCCFFAGGLGCTMHPAQLLCPHVLNLLSSYYPHCIVTTSMGSG